MKTDAYFVLIPIEGEQSGHDLYWQHKAMGSMFFAWVARSDKIGSPEAAARAALETAEREIPGHLIDTKRIQVALLDHVVTIGL